MKTIDAMQRAAARPTCSAVGAARGRHVLARTLQRALAPATERMRTSFAERAVPMRRSTITPGYCTVDQTRSCCTGSHTRSVDGRMSPRADLLP
ncbi:hypothetical protein, partial [Xanthomonas phaseoli]|uniref:hypothetical protein n=1 Tax=Xanthomonas phaseoli TaxID=1985254 RepID=UPI001ED97BCB